MTGRTPARLHLTTYLPGRADAASQKLLHPPMRQQLPLEETTLAESLRARGYAHSHVRSESFQQDLRRVRLKAVRSAAGRRGDVERRSGMACADERGCQTAGGRAIVEIRTG